MCTRPAARRASLIVGMEFTIESCLRGHHFSRVLYIGGGGRVGLSVNVHEEGDPNDVYMVTIKTDVTKTVQSKR